MEGMPFTYNEMIRRHPDAKEFVEKCWQTQCRKSDRIVELEQALTRVVKHWDMRDRGPSVGYSKQEEAVEQARAVLKSRRPK